MARRFKADGFFRPFGMMRKASRSGNWSERSGRQMDGTMSSVGASVVDGMTGTALLGHTAD